MSIGLWFSGGVRCVDSILFRPIYIFWVCVNSPVLIIVSPHEYRASWVRFFGPFSVLGFGVGKRTRANN